MAQMAESFPVPAREPPSPPAGGSAAGSPEAKPKNARSMWKKVTNAVRFVERTTASVNAIKGDGHTVYLVRREEKRGLGIKLHAVKGNVVVSAVTEGGPAALAGCVRVPGPQRNSITRVLPPGWVAPPPAGLRR